RPGSRPPRVTRESHGTDRAEPLRRPPVPQARLEEAARQTARVGAAGAAPGATHPPQPRLQSPAPPPVAPGGSTSPQRLAPADAPTIPCRSGRLSEVPINTSDQYRRKLLAPTGP